MKRLVWRCAVGLLALAGGIHMLAAVSKPEVYHGMSDASAAVALGQRHFVAADDEGNVLRVYQRGEKEPVREFDLSHFLKAKNAEADLEGAARVGDRIYWISSHGRKKEGGAAPSRQCFFATQISGPDGLDLIPTGRPYHFLLEDLLAEPKLAGCGLAEAVQLSPNEPGGFNIEGMCAGADGALLIGLRSPVPMGKALVVELLNPQDLISGKRACFGKIQKLDLSGFGVRDISGAEDGFLILGGAPSKGRDFGLFLWKDGGDQPETLPTTGLEKLRPEAIFRFSDDPPGRYQVLSDDGSVKKHGQAGKDLPQAKRRFRAAELTLETKPSEGKVPTPTDH